MSKFKIQNLIHKLKYFQPYQVDCNTYSKLCGDMFVTRYPTLFVLKDGGYERYHGEQYSLFQICILYSLL